MPFRAAPLVAILSALFATSAATALDPGSGTCRFDPKDDEKCGVGDRYRMPACDFKYTLSLRHDLTCTGVRVYDLTFPSPIKTDIAENNTVHCELFLPPGDRFKTAMAELDPAVKVDVLVPGESTEVVVP